MRVMVLMKASETSESGGMPADAEQLLANMGAYNEELMDAGIILAGEGLQASSKGKRVRFDAGKTMVVDGPFAETKELLAGFWMWQVKSMDEAVEWLKRCPVSASEVTEIEIRPVMEMDDFGDEFTPELREQEVRLRKQLEEGVGR